MNSKIFFPTTKFLQGKLNRIAMNKLVIPALLSALVIGCGGGDVSRYSDDDIPSPVVDSIDSEGNIDPSAPGADPASNDELSVLPEISVSGVQFADSNVLITLSGEVTAKGEATITNTLWIQSEGPSVTIPSPDNLENTIVVPDFLEETQLLFQLIAQDSEGRVNAATTAVVVAPTPAFARVAGSVVNEAQEEATFIVILNSAQPEEVIVDYTTIPGTAEPELDYFPQEGFLTFAPGETQQSVVVPLLNNEPGEGDEFFSLQITFSQGDSTSTNAGSVVIQNNPDLAPVVQEIAFNEPGPFSLEVGETLDNPITEISAPGTGELTYSSSDDEVATVSETGLVTAIAEGEAIITATKAADDIYPLSANSYELSVVDTPAPLLAPALGNLQPRILTVNTPISDILFENGGGAELTECSADVLPTGLVVEVSDQELTCVIRGTPTTLLEDLEVQITAVNATGESTATVTLAVSNGAPILVAPQDTIIFVINQPITPLVIENIGGGQITECNRESLPEGLEIEISNDGNSCQLVGTPTRLTSQTGYDISARNAIDNDIATLFINVVNPAPLLSLPASAGNLLYSIGETITPVTFINSGEGELTSCAANTLPPGLRVDVTTDRSTCELSGTPTAIAQDVYVVTATNAAGSGQVEVFIEVNPLAPLLSTPAAQVYTVGTPQSFTFENTGGGLLDLCSANTLPAGLSVRISDDGSTCVIEGTPTAVQPATTHTITAANNTDGVSQDIVITVVTPVTAPRISNLNPVTLVVGERIPTPTSSPTPITFFNGGGGQLTSCDVVSGIPPGLTARIAINGADCEIVGTPTAELNPGEDVEVRATNAGGNSTASVEITVLAVAPPLLLSRTEHTFTVGSPIDTLILQNNGGEELTSCRAPRLPDGLSVGLSATNDTCEITGTPTQNLERADYEITATNAGGSQTVAVSIATPLLEPELRAPSSPLVFGVDAPVAIQLSNTGGGSLSACETADTLPSGLNLSLTEDNSTCVIEGTPNEPTEEAQYTITATNVSGSSTINVSIEAIERPAFGLVPEPIFFGPAENIFPLELPNEGGGSITSCEASPELPPGIVVQPSDGAVSCELTGIAPEFEVEAGFSITATNAGGSDSVDIIIVVEIPR